MLEDLREWVQAAVAANLPLSDVERAQVVDAAMAVGTAIRGGEIVGLCRVTQQMPWVKGWWRSERGQQALAELANGPDVAWIGLNEALCAPAPDVLDANWPSHKVFREVDVPAGATVGDAFVVGDAEGRRYLMRVIERDGVFGCEVARSLGAPLDSFWWQAVTDAERLLAPQ